MNIFHRIGLLGLIALTALATAAMAATAAQAGTFTAGAYPATITGSAVGVHLLTTERGAMECAPSFDGELAAASEELTVTPNFGTCKLGANAVNVKNNGCDFRLHAGLTSTLVEDLVSGTMDVVCPQGSAMDFEITSTLICHLTIPAQLGLGTLTFTNRTAAKDVDANFSIGGLKYTLDAGCPGAGNYTNGTYGGTSTLKADHGGVGTSFAVE
jgi:hypothetical protein